MKTLATIALLFALAACSSDGANDDTKPVMSAQQVAAKVGCQHWHPDGTQMFTRLKGHCSGVPGLYLIASFNNNEARDNWLSAASGMGGVYLYGNRWVVAAHNPAAARVAQAKVGGEIQ